MNYVVLAAAYFLFIYSLYKIIFFFKQRGKKDLFKMSEISLLIAAFKLKITQNNINMVLNLIALCNAAIFTIVLMSTILIKTFFIRALVMFGLLFPLIYLAYYILAKYLKKRGL